jgi:uncharacterized protein YjcR
MAKRDKIKESPEYQEAREKAGYEICGARRNKKDGICMLQAGFGTPHKGTGRCKYHGGMSTSPTNPELLVGKNNALKTGQFEKIYGSALTEEELEIFDIIDHDKLKHIKEELVITTIRERRMMLRIAKLKSEAEDLIITSKTELTGSGSAGNLDGGQWSQEHLQYTNKLDLIHKIEEAPTKVQATKTKQIELLQRFENGGLGDTSAIDKLVARWEQEADQYKESQKQQPATIKVTIGGD